MSASRSAFLRFVFVVGTALAVVLVAAACGGSSNAKSSDGSSKTVKVSEKEWSITVAGTELTKGNGDASVSTGTVTFEITNDGNVAHELEISGNGIDQKTGTIDPGKSATLKVDLKPGKYEVWCPVPGHKDLGMDGHMTAS
ncbi:MAG TPA: cupredoxin domain-containing protein [Nitrolancea sp.]|jgi:uncharacterized cupredoxin-like copper-binding protein|nr:cupredoxin domain-containing protein [Nitrolancea sp.]